MPAEIHHSYPLRPIGLVRCHTRYRYEVPRQGVMGEGNQATIELENDADLRQGVADLNGFDRVWILFIFHLNEDWRPRVQPPHARMKKVGVFATRSPHRPNRLGLSCVELVSVDRDTGRLQIRNHDLLDRTPVVDIKPYVPYADAFPEAHTGWRAEHPLTPYDIQFDTLASQQMSWIQETTSFDLVNFVRVQLRYDPTDAQRKRITPVPRIDGLYDIAFRTWRIRYRIDEAARHIRIEHVRSGYPEAELQNNTDPHSDKAAHRDFRRRWPATDE